MSNLIRKIAVLSVFSSLLIGYQSYGEDNVQLGYPEVGYPPYLMPKGTDSRGIAVDFFEAVAAKEGFQLEILFIPDNRVAALQLTGKLDAAGTAREWTDAPERFLWSDPIIQVQDNVIYLATKNLKIEGVKSLSGLRLGTMLSYHYPSLDGPFSDGTIKRNDTRNFKSLLKMVHLGRVDAAILDRNVALWTLKENPDLAADLLMISEYGFDPVGFRFRIARSDKGENIVHLLNKYLKQMRANGQFDKILSAYR